MPRTATSGLSRIKVRDWLWAAVHVFHEDGEHQLAYEAEDMYLRLGTVPLHCMGEYADLVFLTGRAWRARLVLHRPYVARAYALLRALIKNIDKE